MAARLYSASSRESAGGQGSSMKTHKISFVMFAATILMGARSHATCLGDMIELSEGLTNSTNADVTGQVTFVQQKPRLNRASSRTSLSPPQQSKRVKASIHEDVSVTVTAVFRDPAGNHMAVC